MILEFLKPRKKNVKLFNYHDLYRRSFDRVNISTKLILLRKMQGR